MKITLVGIVLLIVGLLGLFTPYTIFFGCLCSGLFLLIYPLFLGRSSKIKQSETDVTSRAVTTTHNLVAFCPNCGAKVGKETLDCPSCGHKIGRRS